MCFGWRNVFDDEQPLAPSDEAQFTTGDFFDRRRVIFQPTGLVPELRVLGALTRDRGGDLVVLVSRAQSRQQPALADEAIDDDQRCDEDQQPVNDAAVPCRRARSLRGPAF